MNGGKVVALEIVVNVSFPVALHVVSAALEELHCFERKALRLLRQIAEARKQWRRVRIEIHKDEVEPFLAANRHQREVFSLESLHAVDLGRVIEGSVEVVGPSVVDATEELARSATLCSGAGAMPADIEKTAKLLSGAAHDDKRFPDQLGSEVVAGVGDLIVVTDNLP